MHLAQRDDRVQPRAAARGQVCEGKLRFDHARHRRVLNFDRNYVRLNEWPEWFPADETTLNRVTDAGGGETTRLGSELEAGVDVAAGQWVVERASR